MSGDQTMLRYPLPTQPAPPFPEAEDRERLARARQAFAEAKLDALVCVAPEHLNHLAGFDVHTRFHAPSSCLRRY
ncbi:MAG: hypothetical protein EOS81_22135 [Mesorhizobium sp.]|nr:MAG: hypothetical protein EOS81_22135 [Mesorhizobium sp.]